MVEALRKFIYDDMPPSFEGVEGLSDTPVVPFEGFVSGSIDRQTSIHSPENDIQPVALTIEEFLQKNYPPRSNLLAPWLQNPALAMIYAWRGVGKTHVALRVAYAVASGGAFLTWQAPEPQPVLYLDGEMPAVALQERLIQIVRSSEKEPPAGYFKIMGIDDQGEYGMPNLSTKEGQDAIKPFTDQVKLIVIDNLSTLVRSGEENKGDDWLPVQQWALRMRAEGRTVLFIHHAGKGGAQRGASRREDVLDTVICLKRPSDYEASQGARFEVHFEKARGIFGKDVEPIEAQLGSEGLKEHWAVSSVEQSNYQKVIELANLGMAQRDIAMELGIDKSTVSRHLRKAGEQVGVIKKLSPTAEQMEKIQRQREKSKGGSISPEGWSILAKKPKKSPKEATEL